MLKFKKLFIAISLIASVSASAITQGKEYTKLEPNAQIKNADDKIIELFSYACIHCYNHFKAGTLKFVSDFYPEFRYEEWQVKQMGNFGYEMAEVLAYAKMLDEKNFVKNSLDEKSVYHGVLQRYFQAYFDQRKRWGSKDQFYETGVQAIKDFLGDEIEVSDILDYASSDAGKGFIAKFDEGLNIAKISGTPAFVVKGKYLVNLENVGSAEELVEIIGELIKLD